MRPRLVVCSATYSIALLLTNAVTAEDVVVPSDQCVLELDLPSGATASIDGQKVGAKRFFTLNGLTSGKTRQSFLKVTFTNGKQIEKLLLLEGGLRLRVPILSPSAVRPTLALQTGHSQGVTCVALSSDGRLALSGSNDSTAILWDIETGYQLRRFEGHVDYVRAVHFSPDNTWVLTCDVSNVHIWEISTGSIIKTISSTSGSHLASSAIHQAAFGPTGKQVLVAAGKEAVIYDISSGRRSQALSYTRKLWMS